MNRYTIFDSYLAKITRFYAMAESAMKNMPTVRSDMPSDQYSKLYKTIPLRVDKPLVSIFKNILQRPNADMVNLSFVGSKSENIPEALTIDQVSMIGADVSPNIYTTRGIGGALVNVSKALSVDRVNGGFKVDAPNELMSCLCRARLMLSYRGFKGDWMPAQLLMGLCDIYIDMMCAYFIRLYNIDISESVLIKFVFAWRFFSMTSDKFESDGTPSLMVRYSSKLIGDTSERVKLTAQLNDHVKDKIPTMEECCEFIIELGPNRMHNLTQDMIYRSALQAGRMGTPTCIGVDYIPYFVYVVLCTLSFDKHPVLSQIFDRKYKKHELDGLIHRIIGLKELYEEY